jgi:hypothetical protein
MIKEIAAKVEALRLQGFIVGTVECDKETHEATHEEGLAETDTMEKLTGVVFRTNASLKPGHYRVLNQAEHQIGEGAA